MEETTPDQPIKSTRTYEEWKQSLKNIIAARHGITTEEVEKRFFFNEPQVKTYYDRALMPDVCFKEMFNN